MKIYTRVVIDMATSEVLEADSYEYDGPVAECKKSAKRPKTPDPAVVTQLQTDANKDTATYNAELNRTNTYTPSGSSEFTVTGTGPGGAPIYRQDIKLSPDAQKLYDMQQGQNLQLGEIGGSMMSGMKDFYSKPLDTSGLPTLQGGYKTTPYQSSIDANGLPALQGGIDTSGLPGLRGSIDRSGIPGYAFDAGGPAATANGVSSEGLPQLWGAEDLKGERQQVQDALYGRAAAYLDPQWKSRETAFQTRLANQGVVEGSEAWNEAKAAEDRARTFDYGDARDRAIIGGMGEMTGLSGIARGNRGDLFGERATSANVQNNAASINNQYALANAALRNSARNSAVNEELAVAGFGNNARGQGFGERLAAGEFGNAARGQGYNERVTGANFANNAIGAGNADAAAAAEFANRSRGQGWQEAYAGRALPLNEFNAFRNASPIDMPQFSGAANVNAANTDVAGNYWNAFDADMAKYNAAMQTQNGITSGLFGLGASAISAPWYKYSDVRLKEDIEPLGSLPDGTGLYEYSYKGSPEREVGVMAQEVEQTNPGAVAQDTHGFKMVDYAKVLAKAMGGRRGHA